MPIKDINVKPKPFRIHPGSGGVIGRANKLISQTGAAAGAGAGGKPQDFNVYASWFDGVDVGNMPITADWQELSGLTNPFKAANANYLFGISDGANAFLLVVDKRDGSNAGKLTLGGTPTVTDVEDIASAKVDGQEYLYFADFGDNGNVRSTFRIYRIKEPTVTGGDFTIPAGDIELITCQYSGTAPTHKDAECLIVDTNGDMWIITKREAIPGVYKLAHAASYSGTQDFVFQGDMTDIPDATSPQATGNVVGGNISPDGRRILVKSYSNVYYFPREDGETIFEALSKPLVVEYSYPGGGLFSGTKFYEHPYYEPQGEAITFDYYGQDYYTCSEFNATWGSGASAFPLKKYAMAPGESVRVEFQDGVDSYAGTRDTYLESAFPTTVHGSDPTFIVDLDGDPTPAREGLLSFDLSSIPANAIMIGATLQLYINTEGQGWDIYRLLVSFDESTVTWNNFNGGSSTPIRSNLDDVIASSVKMGNDQLKDTTLDTVVNFHRGQLLLSEVQAAFEAGQILKMAILATHASDGEQFGSREAVTVAQRPKLMLRYRLP